MKPKHVGGYTPVHTELCERTLVTLLRGLGPWKQHVYVVGGLVPRYLISQSGDSEIPSHAGTTDVDIVLNLELLINVEAYRTLEKNLKHMGFNRGINDDGNPQHYQWIKPANDGITIVVDLLCDAPMEEGGQVLAIPRDKRLSALKIPGAYLVVDDFVEIVLEAEMLDDGGVARETLQVANVGTFLALKCLAYEDRFEEKDAYDIVYTLTYFADGPASVAEEFRALSSRFPADPILAKTVEILRNRFASDAVDGYRKDGPTSYARFLADPGRSDRNLLHRRNAAEAVEAFLAAIAQ